MNASSKQPRSRAHPPDVKDDLDRLYRTPRWYRLRRIHLNAEPYCRMCRAEGRQVPAKAVDHIVPHRGDMNLMWDETNLQSLCVDHHNRDKQQQDVRGHSTRTGSDGLPTDPNHPWNT